MMLESGFLPGSVTGKRDGFNAILQAQLSAPVSVPTCSTLERSLALLASWLAGLPHAGWEAALPEQPTAGGLQKFETP
jgi:hypothetical protein